MPQPRIPRQRGLGRQLLLRPTQLLPLLFILVIVFNVLAPLFVFPGPWNLANYERIGMNDLYVPFVISLGRKSTFGEPEDVIVATHPQTSVKDNDHSPSTIAAATVKEPPTPFPHAVFIGDSLLRYSFLAWLHSHHHSTPYAPDWLINEKKSDSWHSYFQTSTAHFEGYMKCDCRRSEDFDLWLEMENRYYYYDNLAATYIQAYGDNQAHGRRMPEEVYNSTISPPTDESGYKWGYMGGNEWNGLVTDYVAKLNATPTLMVFNAGFWPNDRIAHYLGSIFQAARDVMGPNGRVLWRGITPMKGEQFANPSAADLEAKEWSYRYPWLSYQAFPTLNITEEDYFDDKHFSNPKIYSTWNRDILLDPPVKHRAFILVGGVRTLNQTEQSILQNLIHPVCAPPTCVAHLVLHFSKTDNRPNGNNDPGGAIIAPDQAGSDDYFTSANNLFPEGFLIVHEVDAYEIGSEEEQAAMDEVERELELDLAKRLRMFRRGDPRRYSMWFARAYAWRYTKIMAKLNRIEFDFYTFCRPDFLWMLPAPTKDYFDEFTPNKERGVWVHSTYYSDTADTFAFLPSYEAAEVYFSLSALVKEGVACLGGPNFNETLVNQRLANQNIETVDSDWCETPFHGWSETILQSKLKKSDMELIYLNAAATILRPSNELLCEPIEPSRASGWDDTPKSHVPILACLMVQHLIEKGQSIKDNYPRPQRLRGKEQDAWSQCLAWNDSNSTLQPMQCQEYPHPPEQLFIQDKEGNWFRYIGVIDDKTYTIKPMTLESLPILHSGEWVPEAVEIHSTASRRCVKWC